MEGEALNTRVEELDNTKFIAFKMRSKSGVDQRDPNGRDSRAHLSVFGPRHCDLCLQKDSCTRQIIVQMFWLSLRVFLRQEAVDTHYV